MLTHQRILLKKVINEQFSKGINKVDLLNAIEQFIDLQYTPKDTRRDSNYIYHKNLLRELLTDIQTEGGLIKWKQSFNSVYARYR